ncbi:MAG: hypothetical protein WBW33_03865 [Bryobacteraceae bacterium]
MAVAGPGASGKSINTRSLRAMPRLRLQVREIQGIVVCGIEASGNQRDGTDSGDGTKREAATRGTSK